MPARCSGCGVIHMNIAPLHDLSNISHHPGNDMYHLDPEHAFVVSRLYHAAKLLSSPLLLQGSSLGRQTAGGRMWHSSLEPFLVAGVARS